MKRALVTRPSGDAEELAAALAERGLDPVLAPMMEIRVDSGARVALDGIQAILLTSANGARALAAVTERRDIPVLTVGDSSARKTRDLGFPDVKSARGDVQSLADLARRTLEPSRGPLLHVAGSAVAGDLSGTLTEAGFEVRRAVLYDAQVAGRLPDEARRALDGGEVDYALFFSPRTAATFVTLAGQAGVATGGVTALALSPAVSAQLEKRAWRKILVAGTPDQAALLATLDEDLGSRQEQA